MAVNAQATAATARKIEWVLPSWRDPRITVLAANATWIILGHQLLYFNQRVTQVAVTLFCCAALDLLLGILTARKILFPLSGLLTGLSLGLLLESYDLRLFVVASVWSIFSKHLIKVKGRHVFNPSNFGIVAAIWLSHGLATVAPGSQWGGDFRFAVFIFLIGMATMWRIRRLPLVLGWLAGYVLMAAARMALGQGGLVFAFGPLTGAEFALFTFVMIPDPKTTPSGNSAQAWWGLALGILDGALRLAEIRFSMFYALFVLCFLRPWMGDLKERFLSVISRFEGRLSRAGVN